MSSTLKPTEIYGYTPPETEEIPKVTIHGTTPPKVSDPQRVEVYSPIQRIDTTEVTLETAILTEEEKPRTHYIPRTFESSDKIAKEVLGKLETEIKSKLEIIDRLTSRVDSLEVNSDLKVYRYWDFKVDTSGWSPLWSSDIRVDNNELIISGGVIYSGIRSPNLTIPGGVFRLFRMRIRRISGSGWSGGVFYSNNFHGISDVYAKYISDPNIGINESMIINLDFSDNTDWNSSYISELVIRLGSTPHDVFAIEWVLVGEPESISIDGGYF